MKLQTDQACLKQRKAAHETCHINDLRVHCSGLKSYHGLALNMMAALWQITVLRHRVTQSGRLPVKPINKQNQTQLVTSIFEKFDDHVRLSLW